MKPEKFINQGGKEGGGVSNPLNDVLLQVQFRALAQSLKWLNI